MSDSDDSFDVLYFPNSPAKPAQGPVSLPSFRSLFGDLRSDSSEPAIGPPTDDEDIDLASHASDADDDELDAGDVENGDLSLEYDLRNKHYLVSSERGRWRNDPMPFLFQRQRLNSLSVSIPSSQQSISVTRPNSEPAEAHSISSQCHPAAGTVLSEDPASTSHVSSSNEEVAPVSPLPPSSPPLSPISSFVSPMLDAVSPLSLSSPSFPSSCSIPECLFLDTDFVLDDNQEPTNSSGPTTPKESEAGSSLSDPDSVIQAESETCSLAEACPDANSSAQGPATVLQILVSGTSSSVICPNLEDQTSDRNATAEKMDGVVEESDDRPIADTSMDSRDLEDDRVKAQNALGPFSKRVKRCLPKRKKSEGGGPRKKPRIETCPEPETELRKSANKKTSKKSHTVGTRRRALFFESDEESGAEDDSSAASGSKTSIPAPPVAPLTEPDPDSEIIGLLIEVLATSRASSLPISSLYKALMQSRPSLKEQKTKKEWCEVFLRVLSRCNRSGQGVFGKVESSGKDDADRPLESQWFYVPENDHDQERAALIRNMMPRPAKRSETKKYKQYYYQPLGKITRWDSEDDL